MRGLQKTLLLLPFLVLASVGLGATSTAKDCTKTCVEVRREGGELVITAKRDPIRPKVAIRKPTPTPTPTPIPTPTPTPKLTPKAIAVKPLPRKVPTPVRTRAAQLSLSDQIRQVLPEGGFTIMPRTGGLIREPLLVRSSGCEDIRKKLPILDTEIELYLRPKVQWDWGDGSTDFWPGNITRGVHIYLRPGRRLIMMSCTWSGQYRTPDSPWEEIPEGIISSAYRQVEIYRAQVFFTE